MDTSNKYIEMCRKAEEIQNSKIMWSMGDFCVNPLMPEIIMASDHSMNRMPDLVWLPRQDQLQEMLIGIESRTKKALGCWNDCTYRDIFDIFYIFCRCTYTGLESLEQAWLSFVMREKFNKSWDDGDWIMNYLR